MEMYGDKKSLTEFCVELCVSAILLTWLMKNRRKIAGQTWLPLMLCIIII